MSPRQMSLGLGLVLQPDTDAGLALRRAATQIPALRYEVLRLSQ